MAKTRIGLFGGSFDPIHNGHLILALDVMETARLDQVCFIPAARSPLKDGTPHASGKQRLAMLNLALKHHSYFKVDSREIQAGGTSYTYRTLQEIHREEPEADLFFILGADQVAQLQDWKHPEILHQLATFIGLERPGEMLRWPDSIPTSRRMAVPARLLQISSTEIRQRIREGRHPGFFLPSPVADFIRKERLYQT